MAKDIIRVSPWHLRRLFNRGGFVAKVQSGELIEVCIKNKHLTKEQAAKQEQIYCTWSKTLQYLRDETRIVTAHQYVPPIGNPTMPDPKYLEIDGRYYAAWPEEKGLARAYYWALGWITGIHYKLFG
jgi:hypothetical protein